jgi:hypothetical protein
MALGKLRQKRYNFNLIKLIEKIFFYFSASAEGCFVADISYENADVIATTTSSGKFIFYSLVRYLTSKNLIVAWTKF